LARNAGIRHRWRAVWLSLNQRVGNLGAGWTFGNYGFWGGLLRVMFAFPAGLLLSRVFRKRKVHGAF